jgi:hypothetical protein
MKRATRWFQMHDTYRRALAKRGITTHYEWLKTNSWGIPIYMITKDETIPHSTVYPINEVCELLAGARKGDNRIRYFNSTFDYMMGIAILEGFERIEIYGVSMDSDNEWANQKPGAEFWIGIALGKGIEIYLPPVSSLLKTALYGGLEMLLD